MSLTSSQHRLSTVLYKAEELQKEAEWYASGLAPTAIASDLEAIAEFHRDFSHLRDPFAAAALVIQALPSPLREAVATANTTQPAE